ncbi:hypothetical protein GZH82_03550 [Staphylococcus ursi]|uniref:hypothetical protein n=1 Tax=Staphylococcus sp. MI 10-1553 TaxID=1912064 RepID=UPI0013987260|nr:hypothetical protein [Staphylococcus sp. MI 10-1553]QHW36503.1 hypothetical protein GZH82_03550 [Staphylococcus sp. MI 10-1553]
MYKVKYASLNYYPDVLLISNIAVAVVFQVDGTSYHKNHFNIMPKINKLFTFDDELNPKFTKLLLNSIKESVLNFKGELSDFTFNYVNNFKFTSIESQTFNDLKQVEKFIENTTRYILHTSMNEDKKMTEDEKKEYITTYLKQRFAKVRKSYRVIGKNKKDNITFDFMAVDESGQNIGFKIINKSNQAMYSIRSFAMHAMINKENLTFILDEDMNDEKAFVKDLKQPNIIALDKNELITLN